MKRASIILTGLIFMTVFGLRTYAQSDDVYYDPNTDKGSPNNTQDYPQQNTGQNYNDGYGTQGARLKGSKTYVDSSGNTIINNNYYEDSYYSTQLERFYRPSCGFGYYDYAYTPAFYWGWGGLGFGYGGYYGYDSYWGWNSGWGLCGYYNPWYGPYGIYGYPYHYGYGFGYGYGYGHGYGHGWRGDGYGNHHYGATANNYYFSEPHHKDAHFQNNGYAAANSTTHPNLGNSTNTTNGGFKPTGNAPEARGKGAGLNQNNGWKQVAPAGWNNNNTPQNNNNGNRANRNNNVQAQQQNQRPQGQYGNNAPQQRSNNPGQNQGNLNHSEQRNNAPAQNYHGGGNSAGSYHNSGGNMGSYHNSGGNSGGSFHSSGGGGSYHSSGGGGGSHGGGGRH